MPKSTYADINPKKIVFALQQENSAFWNARQNFNSEKLAHIRHSIQKSGLIQQITVRKLPNDSYQVVCGDQRLRSILLLLTKNQLCYDKKTGTKKKAREVYKTMYVQVLHNCSDKEAAIFSIAENLNRDDVTDVDLMRYCIDLDAKRDEHGKPVYTRTDIEEIIGRSATWISQTMNLYNLPGKAKDMLATGKLPRTVALNLLKVEPSQADRVLKLASAIADKDFEKNKDRIESEVSKLEDDYEDAEIVETSAEAMGTAKEKRTARTAARQLEKKLNDAKARKETAKNRKSRLSADSIQTAASILPGALTGKASGLSHKLLRSMVADLQEHLDKGKSIKHQYGKAFEVRDLKLAQAILEMAIGQTHERDVFGLLASFYAEEGKPGWSKLVDDIA